MSGLQGLLEGIWISASAGGPMVSLSQVEVEKGRGLIGDRYHGGEGTFSRWQRPNRAVSLIESEALEGIMKERGIDLSAGRHRRNLTTKGVSLSALVGGHFRIGTVLFRASATCPPCRYLERSLGQGVFEALRNRGGIRAEVVESGLVKKGDPLVSMQDQKALP